MVLISLHGHQVVHIKETSSFSFFCCTSLPTNATSIMVLYLLSPITSATAPPAAGAGGDPHVIAFFGQAFTYQGICDTVLSSSPDAIGGLGFRMHARLTAAKKKKGEAGYSYISEVVVEIGIDRYEFQSEEAKLYLNSKLHPLDDDEKFTPTRFSAEPPYALKKTVKGQRKHIVEYKFDFFNGSSVTIRSNRHFKMIFVDIVGTFDGADLHGLLGSPHKKGLFKRNGENMEGKDINDYGQDWQVLVSEPKLFMDAEREPQSPSKCIVIMDTTSGIDGNDATAQLRGRRRLLEIGDGGTAAVDTIMEIAAQNACSHIIHSKMKEYCIDDVMATGNLEVADEPFWEHY